MPAIHPARLKQQAALVADHFDNPDAFVRSLYHLFDYYADRASRPGQSGRPAVLLNAYHVKPPVLRQVLVDLAPLANDDPQAGLALSDRLWQEPFVEFRMLAAGLLGQIRLQPGTSVLDRAVNWVQPDTDLLLIDAVLTQGLARLRREDPSTLIRAVEDWLAEKDNFSNRLGLRALIPLAGDPNFANLPRLFRLVQPFIRIAPPPLRLDILDLLYALARRSPVETASYLRQMLAQPENPDTAWLIRQSLPAFSLEQQARLRSAIRGL